MHHRKEDDSRNSKCLWRSSRKSACCESFLMLLGCWGYLVKPTLPTIDINRVVGFSASSKTLKILSKAPLMLRPLRPKKNTAPMIIGAVRKITASTGPDMSPMASEVSEHPRGLGKMFAWSLGSSGNVFFVIENLVECDQLFSIRTIEKGALLLHLMRMQFFRHSRVSSY